MDKINNTRIRFYDNDNYSWEETAHFSTLEAAVEYIRWLITETEYGIKRAYVCEFNGRKFTPEVTA